jgi:hypothetical protein
MTTCGILIIPKTVRRTFKPATYMARFVHQFKITLQHVEPVVWRRILVPAEYSFWDLHVAIQDAMGWLDCHLHSFQTIPANRNAPSIGIPDYEDDPETLAGWEIPVTRYFEVPGSRMEYVYDFGDYWQHEVLLEDILLREKGTRYPRCLEGERACPPEDVGGPPGYERMREALARPRSAAAREYVEWLGGSFGPDKFDCGTVKFANPTVRWKKAFRQA